ncbi:protein REDUCED WALL ACETYLATION 1-like [Cynara cardunculus var. scolymus]|uniref:protein REDUCED WALL ACETYLATION 1-like n=1 Tax=Cynara cardunculus var. scolymus TaxID=59895 RepID=UPI000D623176|nr:protein REDUCED WALL ACETYLATION 1-like [Cynara cardunculus var. scolymus]
MVISGPLTPAQVSFLLGIIPVCVAWLYSEFLEYKKTAASLKTDSDINLVELGNDTVKEDDRAVLLEGGGLQSASPRSHGSFIASPVVRLFTMEESFLLENRLTLRAISEFGIILFYFYLCDRTNFFGDSKKVLASLLFFLC